MIQIGEETMTTRSADSVSPSIPLGIPSADAMPAEVLETAAPWESRSICNK